METHDLPKPMPEGSSAFARVLADIQMPPIVEVSTADETDSKSRRGSNHNQLEEGKIVHGLHHCYKMEGGKYVPCFHCNHDHLKLSSGHLEEIAPSASPSLSPQQPRRRMSVTMTPSSLQPPDDFRPRSLSDAALKRRESLPAAHFDPSRRGSVDKRGSPESPAHKSPSSQRRGSNVALHSQELHYVYDQYLKK